MQAVPPGGAAGRRREPAATNTERPGRSALLVVDDHEAYSCPEPARSCSRPSMPGGTSTWVAAERPHAERFADQLEDAGEAGLDLVSVPDL